MPLFRIARKHGAGDAWEPKALKLDLFDTGETMMSLLEGAEPLDQDEVLGADLCVAWPWPRHVRERIACRAVRMAQNVTESILNSEESLDMVGASIVAQQIVPVPR